MSNNLIVWGSNEGGALNIPDAFSTELDIVKSGTNVFKKISLGFDHVTAQYSNNYLVGWGDNSFGQNNFSRGYTMTDFDAGMNTNYFVDSFGRLHGLGQDLLFSDVSLYTGQIINPQILTDRGSSEGGLPQPLNNYNLGIKSVKAGSGYVIALTTGGKITGWGTFAIPPEENIITGQVSGILRSGSALVYNVVLNSGSYVTINLTGSWSGLRSIWTQSSNGVSFSGLNLYNNNVAYLSGLAVQDKGVGPAIYNGYLDKDKNYLRVILTGRGSTPATSGSGILGVLITGYLGTQWQNKSMVINHSAFNRINSIGKVKEVAAGYSHALALFENGVITGWGDNLLGQLSFSTPSLSGIMSGVKIATKVNENLFLGAAYPIITNIATTGLLNSDPTGWKIDYKDNRLGVTGIIVESSLDQILWNQSQLQLASKTASGSAINFDSSDYYVRLISISGSIPVTGMLSIFNPALGIFKQDLDYKLYNEYKPFLQNQWTQRTLWRNFLPSRAGNIPGVNLSQILFNKDGSKQMLCRDVDVLRSEDFGKQWFYKDVNWNYETYISGYSSNLSPDGDTWNVVFNSGNLFPEYVITGRKFYASGLGEEVFPVGQISGQLNTMSGIISGTFKDQYDYEFPSPDYNGDFWEGTPGAEDGVVVLITGLGALNQEATVPNNINFGLNLYNLNINSDFQFPSLHLGPISMAADELQTGVDYTILTDIRQWIALSRYGSSPFTFQFKNSHSSDLYTVLVGGSGENDSGTYNVDPVGINTTLSSSGRLWLFPNWNSGLYSGYLGEDPMVNAVLVKSLVDRYFFPYSPCEESVCPTYPQEFYERTSTIKSFRYRTGNATGDFYWQSAKITNDKNVYGIVENNTIGKNLASISFTSGVYINNSPTNGVQNIPNAFSGNVLQIYSNNRNWVDLDISEDGKYQTAVANTLNSGYIYITSDSGNNWKEVGLYSGLFKKVKVSSNGKYQILLNETGNLKDVYSSNDYGNSWIPNRFYDNWIDVAVANNGLQAVINSQNLYYNYFKDYNENFKKIKDSQILDISAGYNSNLVITKNKISYEDDDSDIINLEENISAESVDRSTVIIKDSWFSGVNGLYYFLEMYNEKPSYLSVSGEYNFNYFSGRKFWLSGWDEEVFQNGEISGNLNTMSGVISGAFIDQYDHEFISPDFEGLDPYFSTPNAVIITGLGTFVQSSGTSPENNFIKWYKNRWNVYYDYNKLIYYSSEDTFYPWQVNEWSGLTTGATGTFAQFNPGYYLKTGYVGGSFGTILKYVEPTNFDNVVCNQIIFDTPDYCPGLGNYPWVSTSLFGIETQITNPGGAPFVGTPNAFTSIIGTGISKTFYTGQFVSTGTPFNQTISLSMGYNSIPPNNQLYSGFQRIITGWTGINTFGPHCIKLDSGSFIKIIRSGNFRLGEVQWFSSNKNPNELSSDEKLYWSGSLRPFNLLGGDLSTGGAPINIFASQPSFENTVSSAVGYLPERDNFLYISGENVTGPAFLTISGNKGYYNIVNCS
jgi:hypothetical protein